MGGSFSVDTPVEYPFYFVPTSLTTRVPAEDVAGLAAVLDKAPDGCSVSVPETPEPEALWVPVELKGDAWQVFEAYQLVEERVEEVDAVVAEFRVYKPRHKLLVECVGDVGVESGARIYIPPLTEKDDVVTLEGTIDNVAFAFEQLQQPLKDCGRAPQRAMFMIPRDSLPRIIGTKGATLAAIMTHTGSTISLPAILPSTDQDTNIMCNICAPDDCAVLVQHILLGMTSGQSLDDAIAAADAEVKRLGLIPVREQGMSADIARAAASAAAAFSRLQSGGSGGDGGGGAAAAPGSSSGSGGGSRGGGRRKGSEASSGGGGAGSSPGPSAPTFLSGDQSKKSRGRNRGGGGGHRHAGSEPSTASSAGASSSGGGGGGGGGGAGSGRRGGRARNNNSNNNNNRKGSGGSGGGGGGGGAVVVVKTGAGKDAGGGGGGGKRKPRGSGGRRRGGGGGGHKQSS